MYASETWEMTNAMMERLRRVEMRMVRWMCGVTLLDKIPSEELKTRMGLEKDIVEARKERKEAVKKVGKESVPESVNGVV